MSEKLRTAYQRLHARRTAINAINGTRVAYSRRFMQCLIKDPKQPVEHLRKVGNVQTESRRYGNTFCGDDLTGWYTDPDGLVMKDGYGLVWGVVYQLPARRGKARFIAGYQFGGCDGGTSMDFSEIFENDDRGGNDDFKSSPAAKAAAEEADRMAEEAAEGERIYDEENDDDA